MVGDDRLDRTERGRRRSLTAATPIELLDRLVALPTVSQDSNLALIDFVRDYLARLGVASRLTIKAERTKANLFASLGTGAGGIVLSGHTDVVPVEGQAWTTDPFVMVARDDRFYGRGTADMKGFIATALALVPEFLARPQPEPIHLAFSYDEEVGCLGVHALLADLAGAGIAPRLAIIGEPTSMQVVSAHKGICSQRTRITGVPAHSSQPQRGVNAIAAAAHMIEFLEREAEDAATRARPAGDFEPPYTTYNVGTISGGSAVNIIAASAELLWEFRNVPWDDSGALRGRADRFVADDLRARLKARDQRADAATEHLVEVPALVPDPDSPAVRLALRLTGQNRTGTVAFSTEAGLFQRAGIAAVICGPGSIDDAHRADEFVARSQLEACASFLRRVAGGAAA
jgi:acetylornithine deacetylase